MDKIIPFAPSYSISEDGQIMRLVDCDNAKAGKVLKQWLGSAGYMRVKLVTDGKVRDWQVHRLLCLVFHGEPPKGKPFACHNDGNRLHNHADNLRWDSAQANSDDKLTHGTMAFGERCGASKLTAEQVALIRAEPRWRGSGAAFARRYGVTVQTISRIRRGVMRKHG